MRRSVSFVMDETVTYDERPYPLNKICTFFNNVAYTFSSVNNILILVANLVWATSAFYHTVQFSKLNPNDLLKFAYATFFVSCFNASLAIIELLQETAFSSLHILLHLLQATIALPCLTAEVWLKYKVAQKEVAWGHVILGLIPTYIYLFQHYTRQDLIDFTVIINLISLTGVGIIFQDPFAIACAFLMFLAYALYLFRNELSYEPVPKQFYSYCMALFIFCAFKTVT